MLFLLALYSQIISSVSAQNASWKSSTLLLGLPVMEISQVLFKEGDTIQFTCRASKVANIAFAIKDDSGDTSIHISFEGSVKVFPGLSKIDSLYERKGVFKGYRYHSGTAACCDITSKHCEVIAEKRITYYEKPFMKRLYFVDRLDIPAVMRCTMQIDMDLEQKDVEIKWSKVQYNYSSEYLESITPNSLLKISHYVDRRFIMSRLTFEKQEQNQGGVYECSIKIDKVKLDLTASTLLTGCFMSFGPLDSLKRIVRDSNPIQIKTESYENPAEMIELRAFLLPYGYNKWLPVELPLYTDASNPIYDKDLIIKSCCILSSRTKNPLYSYSRETCISTMRKGVTDIPRQPQQIAGLQVPTLVVVMILCTFQLAVAFCNDRILVAAMRLKNRCRRNRGAT